MCKQDYDKKVREEDRLREADDTDSHHIAVAKFMQKVTDNVLERYLFVFCLFVYFNTLYCEEMQ